MGSELCCDIVASFDGSITGFFDDAAYGHVRVDVCDLNFADVATAAEDDQLHFRADPVVAANRDLHKLSTPRRIFPRLANNPVHSDDGCGHRSDDHIVRIDAVHSAQVSEASDFGQHLLLAFGRFVNLALPIQVLIFKGSSLSDAGIDLFAKGIDLASRNCGFCNPRLGFLLGHQQISQVFVTFLLRGSKAGTGLAKIVGELIDLSRFVAGVILKFLLVGLQLRFLISTRCLLVRKRFLQVADLPCFSERRSLRRSQTCCATACTAA